MQRRCAGVLGVAAIGKGWLGGQRMARRSRPEQKEAAKGTSGKTRTGSFDWHTRYTVKVGVLGRGRGYAQT